MAAVSTIRMTARSGARLNLDDIARSGTGQDPKKPHSIQIEQAHDKWLRRLMNFLCKHRRKNKSKGESQQHVSDRLSVIRPPMLGALPDCSGHRWARHHLFEACLGSHRFKDIVDEMIAHLLPCQILKDLARASNGDWGR
jgi:hypothetical protein